MPLRRGGVRPAKATSSLAADARIRRILNKGKVINKLGIDWSQESKSIRTCLIKLLGCKSTWDYKYRGIAIIKDQEVIALGFSLFLSLSLHLLPLCRRP
jgi:hypothetical protein